jgi:hypothetical protein
MDGKSICNLRRHWHIDGLMRLNSWKTLTFSQVYQKIVNPGVVFQENLEKRTALFPPP